MPRLADLVVALVAFASGVCPSFGLRQRLDIQGQGPPLPAFNASLVEEQGLHGVLDFAEDFAFFRKFGKHVESGQPTVKNGVGQPALDKLLSPEFACKWGITVLSGVVYAVCGLFHSLLFHALYSLFSAAGLLAGDVREAVLYTAIICPPLQYIQCYELWVKQRAGGAELNMPLTVVMTLAKMIALPVGLYLSTSDNVPTVSLQLLLAIAMALCVAGKLHEMWNGNGPTDKKTTADIQNPRTLAIVVLGGLASGFYTGAIGANSPVKMCMVVLLDMGSEEWRSTAAASALPFQTLRFAMLVAMGQIDVAQRWLEIAVLCVALYLGVRFGNMLAPMCSGKRFTLLILAFMSASVVQICLHVPWGTIGHHTLQMIHGH